MLRGGKRGAPEEPLPNGAAAPQRRPAPLPAPGKPSAQRRARQQLLLLSRFLQRTTCLALRLCNMYVHVCRATGDAHTGRAAFPPAASTAVAGRSPLSAAGGPKASAP